jgi:hypothetical protein
MCRTNLSYLFLDPAKNVLVVGEIDAVHKILEERDTSASARIGQQPAVNRAWKAKDFSTINTLESFWVTTRREDMRTHEGAGAAGHVDGCRDLSSAPTEIYTPPYLSTADR